jgi:hypothetical protein
MSSINPNNINGQYPIAGQDNDSQGFRDNFTNIKNNLSFAKTEIENIEQRAILKTALPGTTLDNELNYVQLKGAQLLRATETVKSLTVSANVAVNWEEGHFQHLELDQSTSLTFTGWPTSGQYAKMRLEVTVANVSATVTLPETVTTGINKLANANVATRTLSYTSADNGNIRLYEFSTYDGDDGEPITVIPLYQPF